LNNGAFDVSIFHWTIGLNARCHHSSMSCLRSRVAIAASRLRPGYCSSGMARRAPAAAGTSFQPRPGRDGVRTPYSCRRTAGISWRKKGGF
jgi:hypothetical protein